MSVPSILHDLIRAGVEFETDGERIRWRNAGGRVTPEVIYVLRRHKTEVIRFLTGGPIVSGGHDKTGKRYSPEAIRQGVADAFEDWEAMNDPFDPRAWE